MKTKNEYDTLNGKPETMNNTFDKLTDEELEAVLGGLSPDGCQTPFSTDGAVSTTVTSKFTGLKTRTGESLNIQATDMI